VVDADVDPAGIGGEVVDAVRDGLRTLRTGEEAVVLHPDRLAFRAPLPAGVGQLPEQFLFLGVHADDRLTVGLMLLDLLVDVAELGIPIRVLCALQGLGSGLQAEAVLS